MVDESHAVLFGGNQSGVKTNAVYILDLSRMVSRAVNMFTQKVSLMYQATIYSLCMYLAMIDSYIVTSA